MKSYVYVTSFVASTVYRCVILRSILPPATAQILDLVALHNSSFVFLCRDAHRIPFRRTCAGHRLSNSILRSYRNCFRFRSPAYLHADQPYAWLNQVVKVVHQA